MPAPIIDPSPITTASKTPRWRFSSPASADAADIPIARSPTALRIHYGPRYRITI